jgi:hypothetical protein
MFLMIFPLIIISHSLKQLFDELSYYAWNHPLRGSQKCQYRIPEST